ncbi:MAG: hypothetical protein RI954_1063, partial [Actinomycetota bacterium]
MRITCLTRLEGRQVWWRNVDVVQSNGNI